MYLDIQLLQFKEHLCKYFINILDFQEKKEAWRLIFLHIASSIL